MAAEPIEQVRQRFRQARTRAAEQEARLSEDAFFDLPPRLQNQLAVLQTQCDEPVQDEPAAFVAAEHNLKSYHAKLQQALDLASQMAGTRRRRGADRRHGLVRTGVVALLLAILAGAGAMGYQYLIERKTALCASSAECAVEGRCVGGVRFDPPQVELLCEAGSDEDCRASDGCRKQGQCFVVLGRCIARSDEDCRNTPSCRLDGLCTADDRRCVASQREDCLATPACIERGECTPERGVCAVRSDEDCQHALACKKHGACTELQGKCVKLEESPQP